MNAYVPFICLAAGALINWKGLPEAVLKIFDILTNMALVVLMLVIGLNIGISREVMDNLGKIGFNCIIISISAILCSVILVVLAEHTVMPLKKKYGLSCPPNAPPTRKKKMSLIFPHL